MKGFEIDYNQNITHIAIEEDCLLIIDISDLRSKGNFYVSRIGNSKKKVWFDNISIDTGDRFKIKFTEINEESTPSVNIVDNIDNKPVHLSKLNLIPKRTSINGFTLFNKNNSISGSVDNGFVHIMISNKMGDFRLRFAGVDDNNEYIWYVTDFIFGDCVEINYHLIE